MKKICEECGKEYNYTHHNDGTYKRYCNLECYTQAKIKKDKAKQHCVRICKNCGKEYLWENKGQWNINNEQVHLTGKNISNTVVDSKKYCCYECGKKDRYTKAAETNLKKYGTENAMKSDVIKLRLKDTLAKRTDEEKTKTQEKRKKTCLTTYGVDHITKDKNIHTKMVESLKSTHREHYKEIRQKTENTCLERYGVKSTNTLESVKEKAHETNLKKYGTKYASQSSEIKEKTKQTNLIKYGFPHASKNDSIRLKIKNSLTNRPLEERKKSIEATKLTKMTKYGLDYAKKNYEKAEKTCMERYGMKSILLPQVRNSKNGPISKINKRFSDMLSKESIEHELEFSLEPYSYDFKVDDTLIEINPTITHFSTDIKIYRFVPKPVDYHQKKTLHALENGYHCIHVWDWDDEDKVISIFKEKTTLYARKLKIKEVSKDMVSEFLNTYHFQDTCNGQKVCLGLYNDEELVQLMTFGKPRYSHRYEWELLRLCTKSEFKIVGGVERLFNHFITCFEPKSIISYCDNSKFTGEVYKRLGMILKDRGKPSKHWFNLITGRHITDNLLRQRGYSQLHNDTIHTKGESNEDLMLEDGYLEIYDCGQSVYTWNVERL